MLASWGWCSSRLVPSADPSRSLHAWRVRDATVEDHLHVWHEREDPFQGLVAQGVVRVHHDERLRLGKRSRRERFQEHGLVGWTDAVRWLRVVQRLALAQVAGLALATAPRA